jgi:hypothetical protein
LGGYARATDEIILRPNSGGCRAPRLSLSIASFLLLMGLLPSAAVSSVAPVDPLVLAIEGRQSALVQLEPESSLDTAP